MAAKQQNTVKKRQARTIRIQRKTETGKQVPGKVKGSRVTKKVGRRISGSFPSRTNIAAHNLLRTHAMEITSPSKILGYRSDDPRFIIKKIESGIGTDKYSKLARRMSLSAYELAHAININRRTLSRRKNEGKISSAESDRLYRLAELFSKAIELFDGNEELAAEWFKKDNIALNGQTPISHAKTHIGANEVSTLIYRLEHSITV